MSVVPVAGGSFLLAVLWFDLMFDVQVLRFRRGDLPEEILASIAAYYRRVTTDARPMGHAVALAMVVTLIGVLFQLLHGTVPRWAVLASLGFGAVGGVLAGWRVVPNAVRLGGRRDTVAIQSALARQICSDHLVCLVALGVFVFLQIAVVQH